MWICYEPRRSNKILEQECVGKLVKQASDQVNVG